MAQWARCLLYKIEDLSSVPIKTWEWRLLSIMLMGSGETGRSQGLTSQSSYINKLQGL